MELIFIHGPPASGKLTVARELARRTGYRLFHNHLTVDLLLAVFDFGSDPFVRLRERIWTDVFREAALSRRSLIFTFNPEATVRGDLVNVTLHAVGSAGGRVRFVELVCPEEEIEQRLELASRASMTKLRSREEYRRLRAAGAFAYPELPAAELCIDTSEIEAAEAAELIQDRLGLPQAPAETS